MTHNAINQQTKASSGAKVVDQSDVELAGTLWWKPSEIALDLGDKSVRQRENPSPLFHEGVALGVIQKQTNQNALDQRIQAVWLTQFTNQRLHSFQH
jgi:hypothetical protein